VTVAAEQRHGAPIAGARIFNGIRPDLTYSFNMSVVSLKAHFDGERILLDEPFDLPLNSQLLITVLPPELQAERNAWLELSAQGLARAYGPNEPE
jgi:hypothetical protein